MSIMIIIISGCIASTRVIFMFMTSCIRHPRMTCMYKTYTCTCIRHPSTDWSDITIIASGHSVVVCRVPYLRYFHVQLSPTSEIFSFWDISHIWDMSHIWDISVLRYLPYLRYFRVEIPSITENDDDHHFDKSTYPIVCWVSSENKKQEAKSVKIFDQHPAFGIIGGASLSWKLLNDLLKITLQTSKTPVTWSMQGIFVVPFSGTLTLMSPWRWRII